jgi:hypothetical protein
MNSSLIRRKYSGKPAEDYCGIIFSHVFYDDNLPIIHVMSMAEALRQRRRDVLEIMILTEKAKKALEKIERKV